MCDDKTLTVMPETNRRRLLALAGGALTAAVAGCSSESDSGDEDTASTDDQADDTPTPTPTESGPSLEVPSGDASLTFSFGGGAPDFEERSFPGGRYTTADCFLTVTEAVTAEGTEATFDGESPVDVDLVLFEDPLEVQSGSTTNLDLILTARTTFDDEVTFSKGWSSYGG